MTKREMIDKYLRTIDKKRVQGDTLEPVMPFLLGDAIYMIYNADIAHLSLRHEAKKARNQWAECYGRFNRPFFSAFTPDESLEVTDLMDDFEAFIGNELTFIYIRFSNYADRSLPFNICSKNVSCRDVRNIVLFNKFCCLSTFSRTRRSK